MGQVIDIKDFGGVFTNADLEDIPKNIATVLKNFRPINGKLTKTFAAGKITNVFTFPESKVSIGGESYTVKGVYCFVNDKLPTTNYRYILILIGDTSNKVRPFWWDWYNYTTADVTDFLAINNTTHWMKTAQNHKIAVSDKVMLQSLSVTGSGAPTLTNAEGLFDTVSPTATTELFTGSVSCLGVSLFDGTAITLAKGKIPKRKNIHSWSTNSYKTKDVGVIADNSNNPIPFVGIEIQPALSADDDLYYWDTATTSYKKVNTTTWSGFTHDANTRRIEAIRSFNGSVIVATSYRSGGDDYGKIFRFYFSGGTLTESVIYTTENAGDMTYNTAARLKERGSNLLVLFPGSYSTKWNAQLLQIDSSFSKSSCSLPSGVGSDKVQDIESFIVDGTETAFLAYVANTGGPKLYTSANLTNWTEVTNVTIPSEGGYSNNDILHLAKCDFGESEADKSLIMAVESNDGGGNYKHIIYRTEHNSTGVPTIDGYVKVDATLPEQALTTGGLNDNGYCVSLYGTDKDPSSEDKLYIYYDDYKDATKFYGGTIYQINGSTGAKNTIYSPGELQGADKVEIPRGFDDIVMPDAYLTYAKLYMAFFGDEVDTSRTSSLYRLSDLSWKHDWSATGDCEYAWRDLVTMFDLPDIYHKRDRNPVLSEGGILRMLPGNVGLISTNEAKGIWLGYLDTDRYDEELSTKGNFYSMVSNIIGPVTSPVIKDHGTGNPKATKYISQTLLYDGNAESLPMVPSKFTEADTVKYYHRFAYTVKTSEINKRVTGINFYVSDTERGTLQLLTTCLFNRRLNSQNYFNAYYKGGCKRAIWIDETGHNVSSFVGKYFAIVGSGWLIEAAYDLGSEGFVLEIEELSLGRDDWDVGWSTWNDSGLTNPHDSGDHAYFGDHTIIDKNRDISDEDIIGLNVIIQSNYSGGWFGKIDKKAKHAIYFIMTYANAYYPIVSGLGVLEAKYGIGSNPYILYTSGNDYKLEAAVDLFTAGSSYSLSGEVSIKVNGQFARILKGLMFQLNTYLDPGGEDEERPDVLSYSELNQYDVNPVSNIRLYPDREGGGGTGLAVLYDYLIIMKKQALFILDVVNPSDPTSWMENESIHNIGNIAPQGYEEAAGAVYVCYYDGIYRLYPNNLAASDATPTERLKITEPIQDVYDGIDDKTAIESKYDQYYNEVVFTWTRSSTKELWAFNVNKQTWRQINSNESLDMLVYDQDAVISAYDSVDKDIKSFSVKESVGVNWKSKKFALETDRKALVRFVTVQYNTVDDLTCKIYLNGSGSPAYSNTLTAGNSIRKFVVKRWLNAFEVELSTPSSLNTVDLERIKIEVEV